MENLINILYDKGLSFLWALGAALIILAIGFPLSKYLTELITKAIHKAKADDTIVSFLHSVISYSLKILVIVFALTKLGFSPSTLVALISTVGVALALGFKDSLGSFVSGILIIFTRPFSINDVIEINGKTGTVKEIQIMNTVLITPDNRQIIIPNNQMANAVIVNMSKEEKRRLDIDFGVGYNTDIDNAKEIILNVIKNHPMALTDPEPFVRVTDYASSSIVLTVRVWCNNPNYWDLRFDLLESIKKELDKNKIEIPFDQLDVHLKN